ncbi:MAG: ThiF family adenylyltransferase [Acidobacteriaceae bacterium]|nr:ThiF family adenylyltransferase [Acidobacteriaceae bacterium]
MHPGQNERYSRQVLFGSIGEEGQKKIRSASVCIVGCGALGSFSAESLARAGVGRLRLIDRDYVDFSNLQRQWLFDENDASNEVPKAIAAARRLKAINSEVVIEPFVNDLTPSNAEELAGDCDVILDGTDNFETRYLLNDLSVKQTIPWIYGAAIGSYGIVLPIDPRRGPCFSCVYPEGPTGLQPTCDINGILSSTTASVAALQVAAALRLLVGVADFRCQIHTFDVWQGASKFVDAGERDRDCVTCGQHVYRYLDGRRSVPVSLCGRNAVQLHNTAKTLDLQQLAARLEPFGTVRVNEFALRMTLPKYDMTVFPDGRAIIKGTTDVGIARSLYAQLLGS